MIGRSVVVAVLAGAAAFDLGSAGPSAASRSAAAAAVKPPGIVTATRITRRPGTLAPGSRVRPAEIAGQRVFTDATHGFALASVIGADYPVATTDGGRTWKTGGPALHLNAAQAPLAVVSTGAVNRRTVFAWGGGQVIDATGNAGRTWYSALFTDGTPVAVVPDLRGHLLAFIGSPSGGNVWRYVSTDSGRTWHYQPSAGR